MSNTIFPCTVTQVISRQRIKVKANASYPSGDYKLVVKSRGGDPDGPLQTSFRNVKYIHTEPTPRIADAEQNGLRGVIMFSVDEGYEVKLLGSFPGGLQPGDKVMLELTHRATGEAFSDFSDNTGDVVSSTDTTIAFFTPFMGLTTREDWDGGRGYVVFERAGTQYKFEIQRFITS